MKTNIKVNLDKRTDFYSKYSKEKLSVELRDYILEECYGEPLKNKIVINIYTKLELSEEEKGKMMDVIRRTFGLMVQDKQYYYEKSQNMKTILLLVGIALIIIYYCSVVSIMREIILILGWLAIWESVCDLLLNSNKDASEIIRLKELSKARIYFSSLNASEQDSKS